MHTLTFNEVSFDIVEQQNQVWLKSKQIAQALGYADESSINRIYARNQDEFTEQMTGSVKLTDPQGDLQITRIFSLRGAHLLAMFARTAIAKEFRKWVLDILDKEVQATQASRPVVPAVYQVRDMLVSENVLKALFDLLFLAQRQGEVLREIYPALKLLWSKKAPEVYSLYTEPNLTISVRTKELKDLLMRLARDNVQWTEMLREFEEVSKHRTFKQTQLALR